MAGGQLINGGRLDQSIGLQSQLPGKDALNTPNGDWATFATVSAMVAQTPGREFLKGDYHAEDKAVFTIRWRGDVDSTVRISWAGKYWDITSVTGTRRTMFLQLGATSIDGHD